MQCRQASARTLYNWIRHLVLERKTLLLVLPDAIAYDDNKSWKDSGFQPLAGRGRKIRKQRGTYEAAHETT